MDEFLGHHAFRGPYCDFEIDDLHARSTEGQPNGCYVLSDDVQGTKLEINYGISCGTSETQPFGRRRILSRYVFELKMSRKANRVRSVQWGVAEDMQVGLGRNKREVRVDDA
jgi:hypothetical protein